MNQVYPSAVNAFLTGQVNVATDTLQVELLDGYLYGPGHQYLADITGRFFDPQLVVVTDVVEGAVISGEPITWPSVPTGNTVDGVVIYQWTGDDATSPVLAFIDRRADTVPLSIDTNDGDISLTWQRLFQL